LFLISKKLLYNHINHFTEIYYVD